MDGKESDWELEGLERERAGKQQGMAPGTVVAAPAVVVGWGSGPSTFGV